MDHNDPILFKMQRARVQLIMGQPFFGSLALRQELVCNPSIETMRCDGKSIEYNPVFIAKLTEPEIQASIAHEIMHIALLHHTRREHREDKKWQTATDYSINGMLVEQGFNLPKGFLHNKAYDDRTAEEIYTMLPDQPEDQKGDGDGKGGGQGARDPGGCGAVGDAKVGSKAERDAAEQESKIATVQAANSAKMKGNLPAQIQRMIDQMLTPKVDWKTVLRDFMERIAKNDFTWARPNSRYLSLGLYLPTAHSVEMGPVVIAVDTSGSIGISELNKFAAEVGSIINELKPESATVIYCDAAVNHVDTFERGDDFFMKPHGGGGTSFRPPFEYVQKEGIEPVCFLYLTDMYGDFPERAPDYPVMWVATTDMANNPFGERVKLDLEAA